MSDQAKCGIINLLPRSLNNLVTNGQRFKIPYFQREYSWGKDDWTNLWDDLDRCQKEHFFGFMTFKQGEKETYEIIEGQQRLTTLTIFLCAIRDLCEEHDLKKTQNELHSSYIEANTTLGRDSDAGPNLTLSRTNDDFFKKHIQVQGTLESKKKKMPKRGVVISNRLLWQCYLFFHNHLSKAIDGFDREKKEKTLAALARKMLDAFIVVTTHVTDDIAAYNIFQTINDRGMDLALSDLLKIYFCQLQADGKEKTELS